MSLADSSKQERIEEFLRKSLLGEEVINTQFHLFSTKSVPSRRLAKPRVLCANNLLLAKSSKYFLDLLSSDLNPSDHSLSDLADANDIPCDVQIDVYGYESDSDFDDDDGEPPIPIADTQAPQGEFSTVSTSPPKISVVCRPKDEELSDDGSESDSSDMFVMSPEHPRTEVPFSVNLDGSGSVASSETAVQETRDKKTTMNHVTARLRSLGCRHILVKDTAFQTWYNLLHYLYTGKINFLPLTSTVPTGQPPVSLASTQDQPRCSAKSMYRLACKVGLDDLRDVALAHIRSNLTEYNILKELSCSLASRHPRLLEMELDVLYIYITSPPVATGFSALAQRIANKELAHGVDIVVGIHTRLLKERQSSPSIPRSPLPSLRTPLHSSPSHSPRTLSSVYEQPLPPIARDLSDAAEIEIRPISESAGFGSWHELEPPAPTLDGLFGTRSVFGQATTEFGSCIPVSTCLASNDFCGESVPVGEPAAEPEDGVTLKGHTSNTMLRCKRGAGNKKGKR